MKKIKNIHKLLLYEFRKHDEKYKSVHISGVEIHIPTRSGEIRCLIYKPDRVSTSLPVFLDFHGGGFVFGIPEMDDTFCQNISDSLKIVVINVDYRLAPEFPYPAAIEDAYDVAAYVHNNPKEFNADPDRIAIGGHSAGANISAVVAMMAKKSGEFSFSCQVLDYPALDFQTDADLKKSPFGSIPSKLMEMFEELYCEPEERSDVYVSPLLASIDDLRDLPPAIIISAGIDSLEQEDGAYAKKLKEAGVPVEYYNYSEVAHGFTIAAFSPVNLSEVHILPGTIDIPAMQENAEDAINRIVKTLKKYFTEEK
ncbi:MAG: alpha/beta hydrolase [Saccharofermentanales bacterium]